MSDNARRRPGYDLYLKLAGLPLGRWLFTRIICCKAPYFSNIRPLFQELKPGLARVSMPKRRAVQNPLRPVRFDWSRAVKFQRSAAAVQQQKAAKKAMLCAVDHGEKP